MITPEIVRVDPPFVGGERQLLEGFLDYLRDTVRLKCAGLSDADARRVLLPSELTTVAGLVAHLTWVELYWFEEVLNGQSGRAPYDQDDPDAEFRVAEGVALSQLLDDYARQCEASRAIVAGLDLDEELSWRKGTINPRFVLIHMIEETGRHAGHLDVLREMIDGVTGE